MSKLPQNTGRVLPAPTKECRCRAGLLRQALDGQGGRAVSEDIEEVEVTADSDQRDLDLLCHALVRTVASHEKQIQGRSLPDT